MQMVEETKRAGDSADKAQGAASRIRVKKRLAGGAKKARTNRPAKIASEGAAQAEAEALEASDEAVAKEKACFACRTSRPRESMLRFVRGADDKLLLDLRRKAPGRGTSVCMRKSCLKKLKGMRWDELSAQIASDVLNTLGLIRRQNRLTLGAESVGKLLASDGGSCAFISAESAERTHKDVRFAAEQSEEQRGLRVILVPAKQDTLATAVGRDGPVGVLGVDAATLRHGMCAGLKEKAVLWNELQAGHGDGQNG